MKSVDELSLKAVIYCRTASDAVHRKRDSLMSQEERCREFAHDNGYEVLKTFKDIGGGTSALRPGMDEMLAFLDGLAPGTTVVLVDDINVLARDIGVYFRLRAAISKAGARLQSGNFPFGLERADEFAESLLTN